MLCDFVFDPDGDRLKATCARCGRVARVKSRRVYAACRAAEVPLTPNELAAIVSGGADPDGWKPLPLGDMVQRGLTSIGITEERIKRWTGMKDCGCNARKSALNVYGDRMQRVARDLAKAAGRFYLGE